MEGVRRRWKVMESLPRVRVRDQRALGRKQRADRPSRPLLGLGWRLEGNEQLGDVRGDEQRSVQEEVGVGAPWKTREGDSK